MKSLVVINPNKFWIAFLNVPQNKWSTKLGQASTEQELRLKGTGRGLSGESGREEGAADNGPSPII